MIDSNARDRYQPRACVYTNLVQTGRLSKEEIAIEEAKKEVRARNKRHLGMLVVAVIVLVMLGLGYYYSTAGVSSKPNHIVVAVRGYLSVEQKDALTKQLNGYAPDTRDKPIELRIYEFPMPGGNGTNLFSDLMKEIQQGSCDLLLVDSYVYDLFGDERMFEDLSLRYPNDPSVFQKYLYEVNEKPFANAAGLENLPELFLVLRNKDAASVNRNAQTLEQYAYQSGLLDNIAYSSPPQDFVQAGMDW